MHIKAVSKAHCLRKLDKNKVASREAKRTVKNKVQQISIVDAVCSPAAANRRWLNLLSALCVLSSTHHGLYFLSRDIVFISVQFFTYIFSFLCLFLFLRLFCLFFYVFPCFFFFFLTRQKNSSYAIDVTAFKELFGRVSLFIVFKMTGIL